MNYVCLVSVVLWYFLIGPLANISSGITGTDTQNVMVALADWLQELFSTNPISTWKHFPASMEYDEDSVSPYCCSRPRHHGILRNDDTHHSITTATGYTALPFMVGPANQKLPCPCVTGPWVQHKFGIYMILFWLARKWFWTSAIGSNFLFILE